MIAPKWVLRLAVLLALGYGAYGQSNCGLEHVQLGAFICYPNPTSHAEDANIPDVFHLSAQANAPNGRKIRRYMVLIDGHRIYENRLSVPVERISIETNVTSPYSSGQHALGLFVDGAGTAETSGLTFHPSTDVGFCDQFSRVDASNCVITRIRRPLVWSVSKNPDTKHENAFSIFVDYLVLYSRNLKSLEADVADATTTDSGGNLYVALHSFADIDLRKYSRTGSLIYDTLVRSRKPGFVSIQALVANDAGRVWIAGNTTAAFATTANALVVADADHFAHPKGFAMSIDTSKSGSQPAYFTYLATVDNSIHALRVDADGNAYIAGATTSMDFPHQAVLQLGDRQTKTQDLKIGFVSVLNASGSSLKWSALLNSAEVNGLAIGRSGTVYVTGHFKSQRQGTASDKFLVAAVSDNGHKLSYVAHFDSAIEDRSAISLNSEENWVFVTGTMNRTENRSLETFVMAVQPRRHGVVYCQILGSSVIANSPEVATLPALDAFAAASDLPPTSTREQSCFIHP